MKYRILAVIVILLALFSINISAASYEYTISPGDNFTSVQYGDDLTQVSQKLNMSADDLNAYFNKNGLLYLAVSDDTKTQIRLSAFTDNFSSAVGDISQLDKEALTEFVNAVSDGGDHTAEIITNGDRKYICTKNTLKDSGGTYTVTQYITICDSKTFYLSCYNEGEDTSNEINAAFQSFRLTENAEHAQDDTLPLISIIAGIVVFSVLAIFMVIGIVKTTKNSKENEKEDEG